MALWIQFAKNAALGTHTRVLEDGTELSKKSRLHAEEGGEVLEGMNAQGRTTIEESRIHGRSRRTGGQVSAAEKRSRPAGIVSKDLRFTAPIITHEAFGLPTVYPVTPQRSDRVNVFHFITRENITAMRSKSLPHHHPETRSNRCNKPGVVSLIVVV
jgi:hypothetical protein